jgi:hypothetical protein
MRQIQLLVLAWALVSGSAQAAEVYRSTGDFGEVTFSDLETPDAQPVIIDAPQPASSAGADWVAQTLDVARMLEESRLVREAAAAERRDAYRKRQQERVPVTEPEQRTSYAPWYPYPYAWRPDYPGHRPPHRPGRPDHRPGAPSHLPAEPSTGAPLRSPIPGRNPGRES